MRQAAIAQLVERAHGKGEVTSSILVGGSSYFQTERFLTSCTMDILEVCEVHCQHMVAIRNYSKVTLLGRRTVLRLFDRFAQIGRSTPSCFKRKS